MLFIRQGDTPIISVGPFVDATDGVTPEDSLTLANTEFLYWKNGTLGTCANGGTHSSTGMYTHTMGTEVTNSLGHFAYHIFDSGTTSLPVILRGMVLHADAYDMLMGSGVLPTDVNDALGTVSGSVNVAAAQSTLAAGLGTTNNTAITNLQGTATTAAAQSTLAAGLGTTNNTAITNLQGTATTGAAQAILAAGLGTTINTSVTALRGTTSTLDQLLVDVPTVASIADGVWDELLTGATHNTPTSAGRRLRQLGDAVAGVVGGTLLTATTFSSDLSAVDDFYNDQLIRFTSGALDGQVRVIQTFANSGGLVTVSEAMTSTPSASDTFDVVPFHVHTKEDIADAVWEHDGTHYSDSTVFGGILADIHGTLIPNLQGTADAIWADTDNISGTLIPNLQGTANAILTDTDTSLPALINALENLSAAAAGTAIWNYCVEERGNYTAQQILSVLNAVVAGVSSNSGLTFSTPDGVSTRVAATVNSSNERTAMTITPGTGTGI